MTLFTLDLDVPLAPLETLRCEVWEDFHPRTLWTKIYQAETPTIRKVLLDFQSSVGHAYDHVEFRGLGSGRKYFNGSAADLKQALEKL